MRSPAIFAALALLPLTGCDNWPLHAHLPDPVEDPIVVPYTEDVVEDSALPVDALQDLGTFTAPSTLTISGTAESCGWDAAAEWPVWPEHPVDTDGDGVTDATQPWYAGWYAGDQDRFGIELDGGAWVTAELTWDNPPDGGENAPYTPPDAGPWQDESDLDVVIFDGDVEGIVREAGFSRSHPERSGGPLVLASGEGLAFVVGCHHGHAAAYTLIVELAAP